MATWQSWIATSIDDVRIWFASRGSWLRSSSRLDWSGSTVTCCVWVVWLSTSITTTGATLRTASTVSSIDITRSSSDRPCGRFFRYDNDHIYSREGHPDAFHKHVFNDRTWKEAEVVHIGQDHFPSLMEVIDELYDWWLRKRDDPLIYP